jgi:hypothetical protein
LKSIKLAIKNISTKVLTAFFVISLVTIAGCASPPQKSVDITALPTSSQPFLGKDYANSQYGFSLSYPAGWTMQEDVPGTIAVFGGPASGDFMANINIISDNLTGYTKLTLPEYAAMGDKLLQSRADNFTQVQEMNTTVSGVPAVLHSYTIIIKGIEASGSQVMFFNKKHTAAFIITFTSPPELYESNYDCFLGLINSFKLN